MVHHSSWSGEGHELQLAVHSSHPDLPEAATPCLAAGILQADFQIPCVMSLQAGCRCRSWLLHPGEAAWLFSGVRGW